jgi:hypothetical protein
VEGTQVDIVANETCRLKPADAGTSAIRGRGGRGRPPQAAARRAGLEFVEKGFPAMMRLGALRGWSDLKSHRVGASYSVTSCDLRVLMD